MAFTFDDIQNHKQVIVGSKSSTAIGTNDDDDQKILGSEYIENALNVGKEDNFDKMEGTVMLSKSEEQQGDFCLEVKDDQRIRDNLWVQEEVKCKQLVVRNINAKDIVTETVSKESCNFLIEHQRYKGKKLRYTSLEGPEAGVYYRGHLKNANTITLPDEWEWLVDWETITVNLTPIGSPQILFVKRLQMPEVVVESNSAMPINCYYTIYAERADIPRKSVIVDSKEVE